MNTESIKPSLHIVFNSNGGYQIVLEGSLFELENCIRGLMIDSEIGRLVKTIAQCATAEADIYGK